MIVLEQVALSGAPDRHRGTGDAARRWTSSLVAGIVFTSLLIFLYIVEISPIYRSSKVVYARPDVTPLTVSCLMLLGLSMVLPRSLSRPSAVVVWLLFLTVVVSTSTIPFFTIPISGVTITSIDYLRYISVQDACFLGLIVILRIQRMRSPRVHVRLRPWQFSRLLVIATVTSIVLILSGFGFSLVNLVSIATPYEQRFAYAAASQSNGLATYALFTLAFALVPMLMSVGLHYRRWPLVVLSLVSAVLAYGVTAFRMALLMPFLAAGMVLVVRWSKRRYPFILAAGLCAVMLAGSAIRLTTGSPQAIALGTVRTIITPATITPFYVDFYSHHPRHELDYSLLAGVTKSPYDRVPPLVIGRQYYGDDVTSENTQFWADSYANFGYVGLVVFTLLLTLILLTFDRACRLLPLEISAAVAAVFASNLANGGLLTAIGSLGFGFVLLLITFAPRERDRDGATSVLVEP